MIIGIDIYHQKGKQMNSVVGFIASMDKAFTEWYSVAALQKSTHQELMKSMQDAFHKVLHNYKLVSYFLLTVTVLFITSKFNYCFML